MNCPNITARLMARSGNATYALYRIKAQALSPVRSALSFDPVPAPVAAHQFTSTNEDIELIVKGRGMATSAAPSHYDREEFGRLETTQITLTIPKPEFRIESGVWCFLSRFGDVESGQVVDINRHSASVVVMTIDTKKVVPFSSETAGFAP